MKTAVKRTRMTSLKARHFWRQHLDAWAASGIRQVDYCLQHGLRPKYMSLWKRKLAASPSALGLSAPDQSVPTMIPVVVTGAARSASTSKRRPDATKPWHPVRLDGALRATLPNGIAISLELTSAAGLSDILRELVRLPC